MNIEMKVRLQIDVFVLHCNYDLYIDFSKYYSGNTCLVHGLTVHTSFTVSHPYPRLEPSMSLKYDDHIVLNTCNFIHVLNINLDQNNDFELDKSENINVPLAHKYIPKVKNKTMNNRVLNYYFNLQD